MLPCNGSVVRRGLCNVCMCVCGSQREENVLKSLGLPNQGRLACAGPVNRALKWPVINHRPVTSANNLKTWEHTCSFSHCPPATQPYETHTHTQKQKINSDSPTLTNTHSHTNNMTSPASTLSLTHVQYRSSVTSSA